ncbi:MAG: bifunctional 5,10-methylenetetrahydrofolate dehydrogenase/5,10-methenyltetrahydrofolate cyclohydrolase [Bacteroidia bacterium]
MQLLDGKALSQTIKDELKESVSSLVAKGHRPPHLVAVLVGDDGASQTYVGHKMKACEFVGFRSTVDTHPSSITQEELLARIADMNADDGVDGMIVQLPLPDHIDGDTVINAIDPAKDADGFHPVNVGRMTLGQPTLLPATPAGIMALLERNEVETSGKHCVVIGRSNIVGRPASILLSGKGKAGNATVTLCHSRTPKETMKELCLAADIIVVALGKPGFLTADMVSEGATVIDVGTTRVADDTAKRGWRLKGDVDFKAVAPKCAFITPVPGGVGPMTVGMLMLNTLEAYKRRKSL